MVDRMEIDRLKAEPIVTIARELGLELIERAGGTWVRCPFHEGGDAEPSLEIDAEKNLFNCFACPKGSSGGDVIRLVERVKRVGFAEAVAYLRARSASVSPGSSGGANGRNGSHAVRADSNGSRVDSRGSFSESHESCVEPRETCEDSQDSSQTSRVPIDLDEGIETDAPVDVRRARLLARVVELYTKNLMRSPAARRYLEKRGLHDGALVTRFGIGYCDGSLASKVPSTLREELAEMGLLNVRGNESLYQCITVPLRGEKGEVLSIYGRSITANRHHYLRGPRRGLVNREAFAREKSVILCEAIIDALSLIKVGLPAVPCYGTQGFTDCHRRAISNGLVEAVYLAFDNDLAGRDASSTIGAEVERFAPAVLVVSLPRGVKDVNDFFTQGGTREGFEALLAEARTYAKREIPRLYVPSARDDGHLSNGAASSSPRLEENASNGDHDENGAKDEEKTSSEEKEPSPGVASSSHSLPIPSATESTSATPAPSPTSRSASSSGAASASAASERPAELRVLEPKRVVAEIGGLRFHVRGRPRGSVDFGSLKVTLRVESGELAHVDRLDLCQARARRRFARETADELGSGQPKAIERALVRLGEILDWVGNDEAKRSAASVGKPERPAMSREERASALALLEARDLLEQAVRDLAMLGYVGEERNKKIALLVAISRLLDKPLAAIFSSASGAGKSRLAELVAELTPGEEVMVFSRVTPQALYYMETGIAHKLLVIDEREGSDAADYSIRSLQTRGKLTLAVPVKDMATGKLKTVVFEIEGPVAYMESTTRGRLNPENENRCYLLHMDESKEQTLRILAAQNAASAGGALDRAARAALVERWRNAQRLLEPLRVLVPFAAMLTFPAKWVRARRDNERLLSLIAASALLHQRQREVRDTPAGRTVVATIADYRIAYELSEEAVALAQSDATRPALTLFAAIWNEARAIAARDGIEPAEVSFTRKDLRAWTGRPDRTVWRQVRELVDLEYVVVASGRNGQVVRYRLNDEVGPPDPDGAGLVTPAELEARIAAASKDRER